MATFIVLLQAVKKGKTAFVLAHGMDVYQVRLVLNGRVYGHPCTQHLHGASSALV
jgi:hypothetical protein